MDNLVSIILPNYNYAVYLKQCIDSVLHQTYQNIELIIIDDASEDGSLFILQQYSVDRRVKILRNKKNCGVSICRNRGIELSKGEYICFIDADDYWFPEKIECQVKSLVNNKANLCFTDIYVIDQKGKILKGRRHQAAIYNYNQLLKSNFIAHSSLMLYKSALGRFYYDMDVAKSECFKKILFILRIKRTIHEDYAFLLKLFREKEIKATHISAFLVAYRVHPGSYSKGYLKKIVCTFNIYRNFESFSLLKSIFCTTRNMALAIIKNL